MGRHYDGHCGVTIIPRVLLLNAKCVENNTCSFRSISATVWQPLVDDHISLRDLSLFSRIVLSSMPMLYIWVESNGTFGNCGQKMLPILIGLIHDTINWRAISRHRPNLQRLINQSLNRHQTMICCRQLEGCNNNETIWFLVIIWTKVVRGNRRWNSRWKTTCSQHVVYLLIQTAKVVSLRMISIIHEFYFQGTEVMANRLFWLS